MECSRRRRGEGPFLVIDLYSRLFDAFGPQGWWPGDGPFEVMVGAVLTQNTAWSNVEKAIISLKKEKLLSPAAIAGATARELEEVVRPSGYFRQKASRLRVIAGWIVDEWGGDVEALFKTPTLKMRQALLGISGIGPETADSILLYAAGKPVFVIDGYTVRIVGRIGLTKETDYHALQSFFTRNLPLDVELYKEYHALLVVLGKDYCRKSLAKSKCAACPVRSDCETGLFAEV